MFLNLELWIVNVLVSCCLVFSTFQSSLVSTKKKPDFGCIETADFTDRLRGFRGMVCHGGGGGAELPYVYVYMEINSWTDGQVCAHYGILVYVYTHMHA